MNDLKDIKYDLINEIMHIKDFDTLHAIRTAIKKEAHQPDTITDAIVELKQGWTLDQVASAQSTTPIHYHEIQEIVNNIEWEASLDELLESIS